MAQVLLKEEVQLLPCPVRIQSADPGIRVSGGKQSRLPGDQGGQAAQRIHKPLGEDIRPLSGQQVNIIFLRHFRRVPLFNGTGVLVAQPRQGRAAALVQADAAQAVQDSALRPQQIHIAGPAHKLRHQLFLNGITHLIGAVEAEHRAALHGGLGNFRQAGAQKVLAQEHAEHGRLRRILRRGRRQVQPGGGGVGGNQQLFPALLAPQLENQRVPAGLVDFLHLGAIAALPDFSQHGGQVKRIKGHGLLLP